MILPQSETTAKEIANQVKVRNVKVNCLPEDKTEGKPLACFESKIIDKNGNELPHNRKGLLLIKDENQDLQLETNRHTQSLYS